MPQPVSLIAMRTVPSASGGGDGDHPSRRWRGRR
jgi:hypothetical protein